MQGGMILNQITNHVREIILDLRTEYVRVPDFIVQILDSYARYKTGGAAGLGISIPSLLNRGKAVFYSGLDEAQEVEDNTEVERHFAYWKHLVIDVVVVGTVIKQTVGITVADLIRQSYSLGHMNENDRLMLLNQFKSSYLTAAAGMQAKKVTGTHGHYQNLNPEESDRAPEHLDELFDENKPFHGIAIDALGVWDDDHLWGRRPISNVGSEEERKMRHRPIVVEVADGTKPTIASLDPILRGYANVVPGQKLGYMWHEGFSTLVQDIRNSNNQVPLLAMGGAGWEFDIDCVKIAGTAIISDPNAPVGELRILHVGTPGLDDGTVFPFYYDPMTEPIEAFKMEAEMLSLNKDRPKGMDFGRPRPTPYHGSEWSRNSNYADAATSKIFLDYIPLLCVVRGQQLKIVNFSA